MSGNDFKDLEVLSSDYVPMITTLGALRRISVIVRFLFRIVTEDFKERGDGDFSKVNIRWNQPDTQG